MQILHDIYPIVVYANLVATAVLPLAIRVTSVWACIALAACARVATRLMLIYGRSVLTMQIMEVRFYDFFHCGRET